MAPKSRETVHSDIESSDDEGVIKNLDYKPPKEFSLHKAKSDTVSAFDVDETVKHEIWLIRVPEGVSNEDLATMSLSIPPTESSQEPVTIGSLKKKEITSNSSASTTTKYQLQTVSSESGFAGEMSSLHALVPDASKRGRLVQSPVGFKHHLALVAQPSIPSGAPLAQEILSRPIPKRDQPEGLKMRFSFMGSETQEPGAKLSGSGKKFAAEWAKVLEKRQRDYEQELLRAAQEEMEEEEEEEDDEMDAEEGSGQAEEEVEDNVEVEVNTAVEAVTDKEEEEEEEEDIPTADKKRKVEDTEMESPDSKKSKKEKKEKKDKKDKKEKKEKKEKKDKKEKN